MSFGLDIGRALFPVADNVGESVDLFKMLDVNGIRDVFDSGNYINERIKGDRAG